MRSVRSDKLLQHRMERRSDEFGVLFNRFNGMLETIDRQIAEIREMGERRQRLEFSLLQAQINPHFLYNTLDMINWLAKGGKSAEVNTVVTSLARFYRLFLNNGEEIVTIERELELIENYVNIQKVRYSGRFEVEYDIPLELLPCRVPRLLLQPLVENAIFHGVAECRRPGG